MELISQIGGGGETFRDVLPNPPYPRHLFLRSKTDLLHQDFYEFLRSKQLIHLKRCLKGSMYIKYEENCLSCFWSLLFWFSISYFQFSDFYQNLEYSSLHLSGTEIPLFHWSADFCFCCGLQIDLSSCSWLK